MLHVMIISNFLSGKFWNIEVICESVVRSPSTLNGWAIIMIITPGNLMQICVTSSSSISILLRTKCNPSSLRKYGSFLALWRWSVVFTRGPIALRRLDSEFVVINEVANTFFCLKFQYTTLGVNFPLNFKSFEFPIHPPPPPSPLPDHQSTILNPHYPTPNPQSIPSSHYPIPNSNSIIPDPQSSIPNSQPRIFYPKSYNPQSPIPSPLSAICSHENVLNVRKRTMCNSPKKERNYRSYVFLPFY